MARPAPAAAKALKIIDLLVSHRGEQFTISDIARRTGSSLGSAHAVLAVLEESGYLTRHPARRTYGLGPALVSAGMAALEQHPAIRAATERIGPLAAELEADVVVSAGTPTEIVSVAVGGTGSRYGPGFREGSGCRSCRRSASCSWRGRLLPRWSRGWRAPRRRWIATGSSSRSRRYGAGGTRSASRRRWPVRRCPAGRGPIGGGSGTGTGTPGRGRRRSTTTTTCQWSTPSGSTTSAWRRLRSSTPTDG